MPYKNFESYKINERTKNDNPRNGMLTHKQRALLDSDGRGLGKSTRSEHYDAIQERVYNTLLDFALLFERWDEHDLEGRERVFRDAYMDDDVMDGLKSFIALLYMDNPYGPESGLQMILQQGVNKAEKELSGSEMLQPRVEFSVDHVGTGEFDEAIRKFGRGKFSEMTDDEAQAIVRMLDRSGTVSREDLEDMQEEILNQDHGIENEHIEAKEERAKNIREKQARQQSRD